MSTVVAGWLPSGTAYNVCTSTAGMPLMCVTIRSQLISSVVESNLFPATSRRPGFQKVTWVHTVDMWSTIWHQNCAHTNRPLVSDLGRALATIQSITLKRKEFQWRNTASDTVSLCCMHHAYVPIWTFVLKFPDKNNIGLRLSKFAHAFCMSRSSYYFW